MQIDFHFFLIYVLAERCGFNQKVKNGESEAEIIAYASQYVDDNNESPVIGVVEEDEPPITTGGEGGNLELFEEVGRYQRFPWAVRVKRTGNFLRPIMTQTVSLKSFQAMFQRYLFVAFHFLPGDPEMIPEIRRRRNPWSTTPNSRNAVKTLTTSLDSNDLYRIGVALHTFADTWSHQNFSGFEDDWNAVGGSILPDIGHAQVMEKPDIISEKWTDDRLNIEIDNVERTRSAVQQIFSWLSKYRKPGFKWQDVSDEFEWLLQAKDMDERIQMVKAVYPNLEYDKGKWIDEALEYDWEAGEVVGKEDVFNSHWFRFQSAVQKQLASVLSFFPEGG